MEHIQQRDSRWGIVHVFGKHRRVRTVPMPVWVKVAIDAWTGTARVVDGHVFRPVNRGDQVPRRRAVRKSGLADAAAARQRRGRTGYRPS